MVENIENTLSKYEEKIINQKYGLCSDCNQPNTEDYWCQNCNSKRFRQNFNKWTSGNEFIDKFIKDSQLKARNHKEIIEWIPYDRLRNIQYLAKGGFSIIYKAIWLSGWILEWDSENQQWKRFYYGLKDEDYKNAKQENIESPLNINEENGYRVVLKSLNDSKNLNDKFLNEWENYLNFVYSTQNNQCKSVKLFGITQDPKTSYYMIVMQHVRYGDLRSNLTTKKYNLIDKYRNSYVIAQSLLSLHKCNLFHGDFHSGNILLYNHNIVFISDLGLSQPADKQNCKPDEIYGVLPYIAPEVLRGKPYTKAADIYSFGIIMWEMITGIPAFNNISHDLNLALNICRGLRPKIVEVPKIFGNTEKQKKFEVLELKYTKLMKRCWDSDPDKRLTAKELFRYIDRWSSEFPMVNDFSRIPVPENEPIIQNHPLSCYTSRIINYSAKLNEILNEEELSSKVVIHDSEKDYVVISSDSLDKCNVSDTQLKSDSAGV